MIYHNRQLDTGNCTGHLSVKSFKSMSTVEPHKLHPSLAPHPLILNPSYLTVANVLQH